MIIKQTCKAVAISSAGVDSDAILNPNKTSFNQMCKLISILVKHM